MLDKNLMSLNKTAFTLITGASSGIGYEFAKIYANNGYSLVLVARNQQKLETIKKELEANHIISVICLAYDLSQTEQVVALFNELKNRDLLIERLINNAGIGDFGFFHESNWNRLYEMIQVNVTSLTQLSYLLIPEMLKHKKGKILNVASTAAFQPGPCMAVYYATKAYVLHFSEALSIELLGTGITVTVLCPGPTNTQFQLNAHMQSPKVFSWQTIPSAKSVAEFGFSAVEKNKIVAVHGIFNRCIVLVVSLLPRRLVLSLMKHIQFSRRDLPS
jgi:short-subunit dehydrogenase